MNRSPRARMRWVVAALAAVAAISLFFVSRNERTVSSVTSPDPPALSGGPGTAPEDDAVAVTVTAVRTRSLTHAVTVNGQVTAVREVAVAPKISGTVAAVAVDVGDRVNEGDVLFRLDDETLRAQLQQAQAALELAEANLARLEAGATEEEREQAAAALRQAQFNLEQAERQLQRMEQLFRDGAVSKEQLDGARTAYDISKAQHDVAEQQMLRVERGATPEELRAARAQVAQAAAARDLARIQLSYAEVRAPFTGLVSRRDVEVGRLVQAGAPAVVLVDIERVYVRGSITQAHVNEVEPGETVTVEATGPGLVLTGTVHSVSPAADSAGLFPVRVDIDNADHRLKPGMFASIRIPIASADHALAVPVQSLVRLGGQRAVYVVEPDDGNGGSSRGRTGTARLRSVQLGIEEGDWVQIVDGVEEGELVVVSGHGFLSDGRRVLWTVEE